MLDYLVIYQSETGNTKKLATTIFSALPGMSKDLLPLTQINTLPESKTYFIGFGVRQGTCSIEIGNLLSSLSGKNVALFGTCGMGSCTDYYKKIEHAAGIWLEDDNQYLGAFFCQGKMPLKIRQKFETMIHKCDQKQIEKQLQNFDEAMIHPTEDDLRRAAEFTAQCLDKVN